MRPSVRAGVASSGSGWIQSPPKLRHGRALQVVDVSEGVSGEVSAEFTYGVSWKETTTPFEKRWVGAAHGGCLPPSPQPRVFFYTYLSTASEP